MIDEERLTVDDIPFLTIIGQGLTVDWLSKERIRLQVMTRSQGLGLTVNRQPAPIIRFLSFFSLEASVRLGMWDR